MTTKVIRKSWGSRLGDSVKGIFFGLILFIGSFVLLWWNEGEAVSKFKEINEVRLAAVEVTSETIRDGHNGDLVHTTGKATTPDVLIDPVFDLSVTAIKLRRNVEMYQWREIERSETRTRLGGGEETVITYSHETVWSDSLIDSNRFADPSPERVNPSAMPYDDWSATASQVNLGSFSLDDALVRGMNFYEDFPPRQVILPENAQTAGQYIYIGQNPASPTVGDTRVSFKIVPESDISVIARQQNALLAPWQSSRRSNYFRISKGNHTLEQMLQDAEGEVRAMAWILRGVGWLVMFIGLNMVFRPLAVVGDVIPLLGRLVGGGLAIAAFLVSAMLSLITIGVAWVFVRPMIGIPLLILAGVFLGLQIAGAIKSKKQASAPTAAA